MNRGRILPLIKIYEGISNEMHIHHIGEPPQKKDPAVFEDNEVIVNKNVSNNTNNEDESQDENIHYCHVAFRADVEHKINTFLGIDNYSVNNFALAHGLGVRESVRALHTFLTVAETFYG